MVKEKVLHVIGHMDINKYKNPLINDYKRKGKMNVGLSQFIIS